MWLINTTTLRLEEFPSEAGLKYAILSHRWQQDEVLFRDLDSSRDLNNLPEKRGLSKIKQFCEQARHDQYQWGWVDTCCIDKSSSAELSEAINSMFHWYRESSICYVHLFDVSEMQDIEGSEWFKRGWTLQELLAPSKVQFFNRNWIFLADRHGLQERITSFTSIPGRALLDFRPEDWCVAEKMSWAAGRQTTREEDLAYCLLGLFNINMPLLYGERKKAFWRLQESIMSFNNDLTILLWEGEPCPDFTLLAASPSSFSVGIPYNPLVYPMSTFSSGWTRNNTGILIQLVLRPHHVDKHQRAIFIGIVHEPHDYKFTGSYGIFLERLERSTNRNIYRRVSVDKRMTIRMSHLMEKQSYYKETEFVTDILIVKERMVSLSSAGSRSLTVRWKAPEPMTGRVCERYSDKVRPDLKHWPLVASDLAARQMFRFDYLCTEAQGLLGYLLVNITASMQLLICIGYDVQFHRMCLVAICDASIFDKGLPVHNVMDVYHQLLAKTDRIREPNKVFDREGATYALRAISRVTEEFSLFGDWMTVTLGVNLVQIELLSETFEGLRTEGHPSPRTQRQQELFFPEID